MNSAETYSLFMHGLNPERRQCADILVSSRDLDEVIEVVKKVAVYIEDKSSGESRCKMKTTKSPRKGGEKGGKGNKGSWGPMGMDLRVISR